MKVFLCWSGDRSKEVARILKEFLPKIIEGIEVDFSEDIPAGKEWFPYIIERTRSCEAGIVCFTPESLHSPWMHFEAGAILNSIAVTRTNRRSASSGPEQRNEETTGIFVFVLGRCDLDGPFSHLQVTTATDVESVTRFFTELARYLKGENAVQSVLEKFNGQWPVLNEEFDKLLCWGLPRFVPEFEALFRRLGIYLS